MMDHFTNRRSQPRQKHLFQGFVLAFFFVLLSAVWTPSSAATLLGNLNVRVQFQGTILRVEWDSVPATYTLPDGRVLPFIGWNISGNGLPTCGVSILGAFPCPFGIETTHLDADWTASLLSGTAPISIPFFVTVGAYYFTTPYYGILIDDLPTPPITIDIDSGNGQSGFVGKALKDPFVVRALRAGQAMKSGVGIFWSVLSAPPGAAGQRLQVGSGQVDSNGQAKATFTLGNQEGDYTIQAYCGACNGQRGSSVTFRARAIKKLKLTALSGNGQTGRGGEPIGAPFVVKVTDADDKPIDDVGVSYQIVRQPEGAVAAGPQGAGKATGQYGVSGEASATLTLGDKTGNYIVEAACADCTEGSPATFTATATGPEGCCDNAATIGSQVNFSSGNLFYDQNLLSLSGAGPQVDFTLSYNSVDSTDGPLGPHWTHPYVTRITRDSVGFITLMEEDGHRVIFEKNDSGVYTPIDHFGRPGTTIQKMADGAYHLIKKDGTVLVFGSDRRLIQIQDRNGATLTLGYQGDDLVSLTEASGRVTRLDYDGLHRLIRLTDPAGRMTALSYDGAGLLRQIVDPANQTTTYTYDSQGHMLIRTDPNGNLMSYAFDTDGRLTSATDSSGIPITVQYQPATHQATLTDRKGGVTAYSYDPGLDVTTQIVAPDGGATIKTYDAVGNFLSITDPAGNSSQYTYDSAGNILTMTDPEGRTTRYTYEPIFNQLTSITDPQGNVISYTYDDHGNVLTSTDPTGGVTHYAYNGQGKMIRLTNPLGQTTSFSYDAQGALATVTDPQGGVTTMAYDSTGNMIARTDPNGGITRFEYDASNRLIKLTDPLGNITLYFYDSRGNKISETDPLGRTMRSTYNYMDKLMAVIDPLGQQTSYSYDVKGNLLSITDAKGQTTSYSYDAQNRLTSETDPLGNTIRYVYDSRSNLVSKTDAENRTITFRYDSLDRLVEKNFSDQTTEHYTYDASGRMTSADNVAIAYQFSYDSAGRVTQISDSRGYTVKYEYDPAGNRTKLIYPDGSAVRYQYDASNRLSALVDWADRSTTFNYDPLGRRTQLTRSNGIKSSYQYDAASRLTTLAHQTSGGGLLDQFAYTYNAVGNRLSVIRPEEKLTYSYDLLARLTQATPTKLRGRDKDDDRDHQAEAFTYDPVGNRLTGPNPRTSYTYNAGNQLTSDGRHQFTYDRNGNLTQKTEIDEHGRQKVQTFSYDDENRLVQARLQEDDGPKTVRFKYDPFGNRIEKRVEESEERREIETATHTYVYDNQAIILEKITSSEGDIRTIKYLQGPGIDEPLEVEQKGKVYFYQADALGSVTALTDERQKMVEQDTYSSFGELKQQGDRVKNFFTFTGREWDEDIGLYYYRARYYDATIGRFISKDLIENANRELNLYYYVRNNPVNLTDPRGLYVLNNPPPPRVPPLPPLPGGPLDMMLRCMEGCYGKTLLITSTDEDVAVHPLGTPHRRGVAADIGLITNVKKLLCCAAKCGAGFAQDEGSHVHVQIPKGTRGGGGDLPPSPPCKCE